MIRFLYSPIPYDTIPRMGSESTVPGQLFCVEEYINFLGNLVPESNSCHQGLNIFIIYYSVIYMHISMKINRDYLKII